MNATDYNQRELMNDRLTLTHITRLTRHFQNQVGLDSDGKCGPATRAVLDGWSPIATQSSYPWGGRLRPAYWRGRVFGLVVHTTGATIVARAIRQGVDPVEMAVNHYQRSTGTHYVIGYDGTVIQVASEHQLAHGVGMSEQLAAERDPRGWEHKVPSDVVMRWNDRWAHLNPSKPSDLFPGTHANACYVHAEMPPLPESERTRAAQPGLWYTAAQHEAVARLAADVAHRNGFADEPEWHAERVVGHEDIAPLNRPGWDPGWLRSAPRFDWDLVWAEFDGAYSRSQAQPDSPLLSAVPLPSASAPKRSPASRTTALIDCADSAA